MKIIRTRLMPGRKLAAINLFGIVFAPKSGGLLQKTINHEAIHAAQMKEMLFIFFICGMRWNGWCVYSGKETPTGTLPLKKRPTLMNRTNII